MGYTVSLTALWVVATEWFCSRDWQSRSSPGCLDALPSQGAEGAATGFAWAQTYPESPAAPNQAAQHVLKNLNSAWHRFDRDNILKPAAKLHAFKTPWQLGEHSLDQARTRAFSWLKLTLKYMTRWFKFEMDSLTYQCNSTSNKSYCCWPLVAEYKNNARILYLCLIFVI